MVYHAAQFNRRPQRPVPDMPASPPIDIVYLWVNGNDLDWRKKRQQAALQVSVADRDAMAVYGNVEGRFRDNDELRYSLRALERYYPDHGHVYVVTDGQTPSWLRASNRLTVVDHRDLIPADRLPIFDSGNIESYIHRIPSLSERFFYFNDDVFFGAPLQVSDWFWEHGVYVAWSDDAVVPGQTLQPDATSLENGSRLSRQWLDQRASQWVGAYTHTPRTFAHSPRPLLKSLLYRLEDEAADLFERVRSTVFRSWATPTIVSDFVLRWALAHGVAKIRDYAHLYVTTGDANQAEQLQALRASDGALDFFCINDTTDDAHASDPRLANARTTLQMMFPLPSPMERNAAVPSPVTQPQRLRA